MDIDVSVYYLPGTLPEIENRSQTPTLKAAVQAIFGGVGAMSPDLYEAALKSVAQLCDCTVDQKFRDDVMNIIRHMPCSLD
jgi:hypothetical protein